jgi:hypothetical protein
MNRVNQVNGKNQLRSPSANLLGCVLNLGDGRAAAENKNQLVKLENLNN